MSACITCLNSKAGLVCGVCASSVCKSCAQFVDDEILAYMKPVPKELLHDAYCTGCFEQTVVPLQQKYVEAIELAKNVNVFFKTQGKETRFVRRNAKPVSIKGCPDRDEALMRLAFLAVQAGYNALIDVDLIPEKVRMGSYQTSTWKGTGIPARIEEATLARKFIAAPN